MDRTALLSNIRRQAMSQSASHLREPASADLILATESRLGFAIPPLLKSCYAHISNGGFGPGYGLIGVDGGAPSDFGTLVETFNQLKVDYEKIGKQWSDALLPFCDFGCNIFYCVDCKGLEFPVHKFDQGSIQSQGFSLDRFFEMWISGLDILSHVDGNVVQAEIVNPFTGKPSSVSR
jgi:SMI1-KNR4 cell-wall